MHAIAQEREQHTDKRMRVRRWCVNRVIAKVFLSGLGYCPSYYPRSEVQTSSAVSHSAPCALSARRPAYSVVIQ